MAVDGFPLFGGAHLAIDSTIVSVLRGDGSARRGASVEDGVALTEGRSTSTQSRWVFAIGHHTTGSCARQKLLVSQFARAKARQEPWLLRCLAEQAWRMRWGSLIACAVARAVALSLLELPRRARMGTLQHCTTSWSLVFSTSGWRREARTGVRVQVAPVLPDW